MTRPGWIQITLRVYSPTILNVPDLIRRPFILRMRLPLPRRESPRSQSAERGPAGSLQLLQVTSGLPVLFNLWGSDLSCPGWPLVRS